MDMRNGKKTYNVNVVKTVDFHSVILPLVLFGLGILVPVITDEFLVIALSFAPFYGYMLWNEKKFNETTIFLSRVILFVSILLAPLFSFLGYQGIIPFLETSGIVLAINVVPSFMFVAYVIFSVESKDPSKWASYSPPSD